MENLIALPVVGVRGEAEWFLTEHDPLSPLCRQVVARGKKGNLIHNNGLDFLGTNAIPNFANFGKLSSDTTAPAHGDTALPSVTSYVTAASITRVANPSGGTAIQWTYTWSAGAFNGSQTVAKLGFSEGLGTGIRASLLLTDGNGNPAAITPLSSQSLTMTYTLYLTPSQVDFTGSTTLNGTSINYTVRAANVGTGAANTWGFPNLATALHQQSNLSCSLYGTGSSLGAVTGSIGGAAALVSPTFSTAPLSYTNGNYYWDIPVSVASGAGTAGPFRYMYLRSGLGEYQYQFSTDIAKTTANALTLPVRHSWTRG